MGATKQAQLDEVDARKREECSSCGDTFEPSSDEKTCGACEDALSKDD
jgi:hypothetical protein